MGLTPLSFATQRSENGSVPSRTPTRRILEFPATPQEPRNVVSL